MSNLTQPLTSATPEKGHSADDALTLERFLELLREEEDYWTGEEQNTRVLISHLRKIFYDRWGWNEQLMTGARNIENRYEVQIVEAVPQAPAPAASGAQQPATRQFTRKVYYRGKKLIPDSTVEKPDDGSKPLTLFRQNNYEPKYRSVVYSVHDKKHAELKGQIPEIYKNNHQEVKLSDGTICDIGHVLAGLDAFNHRNVVTPLPDFFNFLKGFMPHVDFNADIVTWLGDIASVAGNFLFRWRQNNSKPDNENGKKKSNTEDEEQQMIIDGAPGSDMLGNIDAFVIANNYNISTGNGKRVTEILSEYYSGTSVHPPHREKRFSKFADAVGLRGWNAKANRFENESEWISYYRRQLRDNTCFQVMSLMNKSWRSYLLVLKIWCNWFMDVFKYETLLEIFLVALKEKIKEEPKTPTP